MSNIDYERVNWENGTRTPLGATNLNKGDKAIDDIAKYINKTGEYILQASNWSATGSSQYPWILNISSTKYSDDDTPIAQAWGMGEIETSDEITSISYIKKVIVSTSGIKVYASAKPTVNLKLVLKM